MVQCGESADANGRCFNADKSFPTLSEANSFLTDTPVTASGSTSRFYGVQRGRQPGVYTDWSVAQDQIKGFRAPKYRKFSTWADADAFVRQGREEENGVAGVVVSKESQIPKVPGMTDTPLKDELGNEYPAGTGPLPPGAEDGFDPNILLDPATGRMVYKTPQQKAATKLQPKAGSANMLRIYTDGSSLGNGKTVAKAGVGVYFGPGDDRYDNLDLFPLVSGYQTDLLLLCLHRNVSEPLKGSRQTNQRAELTAISRALDIAPRHRDVTIFTDSKYAINCVTTWCTKWRRNKWMTADSKPVENKDLIQSILAKMEERTLLKVQTLFEWVKGHSKDEGNEAADRLAVRGARAGLQQINDGVGVKNPDVEEEDPSSYAM